MVPKLASFRDLVIRGQSSYEIFKELARYFVQLLVHGKSTWLNENHIEKILAAFVTNSQKKDFE